MLKIYLRQSGFTYSVCRLFTKNKKKKKKYKDLKKKEIQDIFIKAN